MNVFIYIVPVLSALSGWLFNKICGQYVLKNYLPGKKNQLAALLGEKTAALIPIKNIEEQLAQPELVEKAMPMIEKHIDEFLTVKLPQEIPMLSMFVGNKTTDKIKEVFISQLQQLFPKVMAEIISNAKQNFDIKSYIVKELEKTDSLSLLKPALAAPLKKFHYLGLLSGFIIGIINVLIFIALR